jgi:regulation of enolase protein 1 (concanavalin A-like superfamily)
MTFEWLNEPPRWSEQNGMLSVTTGARTDFWNRTHYGFTHSNGHFRYCSAGGDFTAQVRVSADYHHLYDQAGLMLRVDDGNWLKCGIEFTDGAMHFSTVVTRDGFSDWSQLLLPNAARHNFGVRLTRHREALRVQYQVTDGQWIMARLAMLAMGQNVQVGMMCCTPQREGLTVKFEGFTVGKPVSRELHH